MIRCALALLATAVLAGTAFAAAGDPIERHTTADMAKARSIVLKRADLGPGWQLDTSPDEDVPIRCPYYRSDDSGLVETGRAQRTFTSEINLLGSSAQLFRTVRESQTSWDRNAKPAFGRCYADIVRREAAKEGVTFRIVRAGTLAFPAVAPRTAAWRVNLTVTAQGQSVPLVLDLVAMMRGRIQTALIVMTAGGAPSGAQERALARLLAGRMR